MVTKNTWRMVEEKQVFIEINSATAVEQMP